VATRFPSVEEVLRDGENAVLIEPDAAAPLIDAVRELLASPARAERLGARARAEVEDYRWERRAEKILAAVTAAAG
jgi:glycosyltransferase involved in cell wall biosynthesis